ncbi:SH3 beta-barrel fold-containing protein [Prevotella corporis]|uniref:SH3 beta-barrel fold-containing protein n=1 Tax=Prevotella corporis TaxID=28128 RepID=UPI002365313C|nr:SH3 beta-barrel fold-containing protein [Prevotella corporis]
MENLFETLVEKLRKGIVSFVYRKKDGTERHACGTLYGSLRSYHYQHRWHVGLLGFVSVYIQVLWHSHQVRLYGCCHCFSLNHHRIYHCIHCLNRS